MSDNCDPACQKLLLDAGMGAEAARLYAGVIKGTLGVQPIDSESALFYARVVETTVRPVAQAILDSPKLKSQQRDELMEQIDQQCYRADYLLQWAKMLPATARAEHAAAWTEQIFDWIKKDQLFYTDLAADLGEGKGSGSKAKAKDKDKADKADEE